MTSITRISKLRRAAVFRDFEWPKDLADFGRYNLIYGWNGTGKTTLSRVFRALELRQPPAVGEAVLNINGRDIPSDEFPRSTLHIRVFNRDFISESVFRAGGGDVLPIFVVGKESVEKQKEVDQHKAELRAKEEALNKAGDRKQQAERTLDMHCIERAKIIKEMLRFPGSAYNDYDKRAYKIKAEQMAADLSAAARYRLSNSERYTLLAQHRSSRKPKVPEIRYGLPPLNDLAYKVGIFLGTTVASAPIQDLKDDSILAEWIRHGLELHKDRKSGKCLFCEQPLPKDRFTKLEAHFNDEYELFLKHIDEYIQDLEATSRKAADLILPNRAELYDNLGTEFDDSEKEFRQVLDTVKKFISELLEALRRKKAQPFKPLTLSAPVPAVDTAAIDRLNKIIREHNQACDDFDRLVIRARDQLALDMITESLEEFVRLRDEVKTAKDEIMQLEDEISRLNSQITQLERDIREHQRPAEELNEDLKNYLGHGELKLSIKETGYSITRNGVQADMLSEGETTAIALLYFLKSLEDRSFEKGRGIVVLDDPVSSLDANFLYLAFGFIRERTKDAGQLFVLTHNFSFFRQVRNWFHHLKGQNKKDPNERPARFYMLDCLQERNGRCAVIRWLDPLLEQYDSEYQYLFARVYRAAKAPGSTDLMENYVLPNIARRLLETFLAFRHPHVTGELWEKVQALSIDEAKKLRILRFLNAYSHSAGIEEVPEHDPYILAEGKTVLHDLLEMICSQDEAHFRAMEQLLDRDFPSEKNY